ncbi:hypothetical protein CIK06_22980 [Plantactinospora sp. KBS50]|nr:hypothetical protein CIK06_22980 [Plantactinospora sp. KBS50]
MPEGQPGPPPGLRLASTALMTSTPVMNPTALMTSIAVMNPTTLMNTTALMRQAGHSADGPLLLGRGA